MRIRVIQNKAGEVRGRNENAAIIRTRCVAILGLFLLAWPVRAEPSKDAIENALARSAAQLDVAGVDRVGNPSFVARLSAYLLIDPFENGEASGKAFQRALEANQGVEPPYVRGRNYLKLMLASAIDRTATLDVKAVVQQDEKAMQEFFDGRLAAQEQPMTQEWQLANLAEQAGSIVDANRPIAFGVLVKTFLRVRAHFAELTNVSVEARAEQAQLVALLERTLVGTHWQILTVKRDLRPAPYGTIVDAYKAAFGKLDGRTKAAVIEMFFSVAEKLQRDGETQRAAQVLRICGMILGSSATPFPRRAYFEVKHTLQLAYGYAAIGEPRPGLDLLTGVERSLGKIPDDADRLEMVGFRSRYLGQLQLQSGSLAAAEKSYRESIDAFTKLHHPNAIGSWAELAQVFLASANYDQAQAAVNSALALRATFDPQVDFRDQLAELYVIDAGIKFRQRKSAAVLESVRLGLIQAQSSRAIGALHLYGGLVENSSGSGCVVALAHFEAATAALGAVDGSQFLEVASLEAGKCYAALGKPERARPYLERAVLVNRTARKLARQSDAYGGLLTSDSFREEQDLLLQVLYDLRRLKTTDADEIANALLYYAEMTKSREITDEMESMRRGASFVSPWFGKEELAQAKEALGDLFPIYTPFGTSERSLEETFTRFQSLAANLTQRRGVPVLMLEYVPIKTRDRALLFAVQADKTAVVELAVPWSKILESTQAIRRQIRTSLEKYADLRSSASPDPVLLDFIAHLEEAMNARLTQIGQALVPALPDGTELAELCRNRSLVIVPHGSLHNLPFGAIRVGNGRATNALIDVAAGLTTPPSMTLLESILRDYGSNLSQGVNDVLLVGDSKDPELPAVAGELDGIRATFRRADAIAVKAGLKAAVRKHSAVHFATHGSFDEADVFDSGLVLKDGKLTLREIMMLEASKTRLVTMGACETGDADVSKAGDEVWSLATGFIFAGIPGVVSSQWDQDGESAANFYATFYRLIASQQASVGKSFRDAVLAVRARRGWLPPDRASTLQQYANPCFWAGFHFIGE